MPAFSIAHQFSRFPAGILKKDGPYSGEHLREKLLQEIRNLNGERLVIDLDGTMGYGSSFLQSAFRGLLLLSPGGIEVTSKDTSLIQEALSYARLSLPKPTEPEPEQPVPSRLDRLLADEDP